MSGGEWVQDEIFLVIKQTVSASTSWPPRHVPRPTSRVESHNFEVIYKFVYLGTSVRNTNNVSVEIQRRINLVIGATLDRVGNWKVKYCLDELKANFTCRSIFPSCYVVLQLWKCSMQYPLVEKGEEEDLPPLKGSGKDLARPGFAWYFNLATNCGKKKLIARHFWFGYNRVSGA